MIDFHSQLAIIPEVYDTATLQDNLEHSGGISLSWKSKTDDEIPLGSYITYSGTRYVLMQPYAPSKESPVHYQYNPMFKHPQALFDFTPFWIKSKDAQGQDINLRTTSYTGFPYVIAQKLVNFMAEYANEMQDTFFAETIGLTKDANDKWQPTWTFNIPVAVDEQGREIDPYTIITVSFDGSSIKAAADSIASAMGCNVFFDWSTKTIRFVAGTTIQGESYNCFHVLGGTTNMGKNTASGSFAAVTQRLTLDETQYPGSIIKRGAALTQGGIMLTKELIFDDIYPKMELYIKETHERLCYLTDEEGDFIVDHWEKDGQTVSADTDGATAVYKTYSKWYISLAKDAAGTIPYNFDQSTLIDDKPLSLLFQMDYRDPEHMSKLVGRQFEMTYFPESTKEWGKTDVERDYSKAWEVPAGWFRIALVAEGDVLLPTGTDKGLYPKAGDKVTLVNVALTDEKATAQGELLQAAIEIIGLMETPAGEYTETVILGKEVNDRTINSVVIGQVTPFEADVPVADRKHGPVVTQINHNLDTNVADVTVGSWTRKTRSGGTADKLETVTVSANSSTNGGDNYSNGSIGEGGGYGGNSTETLNQTTLKPDSLFVASLSNTIDAVSCDASGKVKQNTDIITKITCNYGTKDITSVCNLSYTEDWPYTVDGEETKRISAFLEDTPVYEEGVTHSTPLTVPNRTYDLSETKRYIRINFPQGFDMAHFDGKLPFAFTIGHPYFTDRAVGITVEALVPGVSSYKSTMFVRMDNTPTKPADDKGSYAVPSPTDCLAGKNSDGQNVYWSDGIPAGENKLWATTRIFSNTGVSPQQSSWSDPRQMTDTDTYDVEFAKMQTNDAKPADPTDANRHGGSGTQIWFDPTLDSSEDFTKMYWRAERDKKNGVWGAWTIIRIKGEKGDTPENLVSCYRWYLDGITPAAPTTRTEEPTPAEYPTDTTKAYPASKWSKNAPNRQAEGWNLWMSQTTKHVAMDGTVTYDAWNAPVRISGDTGSPGADGSDIEWIYKFDTSGYNGNTGQVNPTGAASGGDTNKQQNGWVPNGWYNHAQAVSKDSPTLYASFRRKDAGNNQQWGAFQNPITWSHWGRNGMDGDGVEYVYMRTKKNIAPELDHTQSGYASDEFRPTIINKSTCDAEFTTCTDDLTGISEEYQYEWVISRTMTNPDVDSGQRSWQKFTGKNNDFKMSLSNHFGESAFVIDLDNNNDQFGTDSTSKVLVEQKRRTTASLYYGSQEQTLTNLTATLQYEDGTSVATGVSSVTATKATGVVEVTIKANNTISSHNEIIATITATCAIGSKTITFPIQKVMSGAPGVNPIIYNVVATQRSFSFYRDSNNALAPDSRSSKINVLKTEGNTTTTISTATSGLTFRWGWDDSATAQASNQAIGTTLTVTKAQAADHSSIWVELSTGDRETLPIVKDGENGRSITKASETPYYIKNTTGVRPAENDPNWSTTKPTLSKGEWLFTKIVISWSDGSTTILYTDERNPNDGISGQDIIIDGSTVMKYYVSTSNTTHPADNSSDWKDLSQVTQEQGKWLWSQATTYYRKADSAAGSHDAGKSINYNVSYISKDGLNGRGIKTITEYYQATNSSTSRQKPTSTSGWSTDPNLSDLTDKWDANHKYLWNMEQTIYTNSNGTETTEYTIPQILAIWTKDGAAGRGIDSIQNHYNITNSLTPPDKTGSWSNNPIAPTEEQPYLWNYETISWTTGTPATTDTDVQMIGHFGRDGISVRAQYSTDGTNWHNTFASGDIWMRTSTDGGTTWSTAMKIVGENGEETDFTFNISKNPTSTDADTPPTQCYYNTWQDAPMAVTSVYPYLWSKVVHYDSSRTVLSTKYIRLTGENGTSPWIADLDNEMDSVSCDDGGYPKKQQSVKTNLSFFYGSSKQSFKVTSIVRKYGTNNGSTTTYSSNSTINGVTVNLSAGFNTPSQTNLLTVAYETSALITGKDIFTITMKDSNGSNSRDLNFIVNGVNGDVYNLMPWDDQISAKYDGTNYKVNGSTSFPLNCGYTKNIDGTITTVKDVTDGRVEGKYNIFYRKRRRSDKKWENWDGSRTTYDDTGTVYPMYNRLINGSTSVDINTCDAFEIVLTLLGSGQTGCFAIDDIQAIDHETVYVISDGADGRDGADAGENLIDGTGKTNVITASTPYGSNSSSRWYSGMFSLNDVYLQANMSYSCQMRIKLEGCDPLTLKGRNVRLYLNTKGNPQHYPFICEFNPTENGTYTIKKENFTINNASEGFYSGVTFGWDLSIGGDISLGTITIDKVKLEAGEKCTAWCLSENDKKGDVWTIGQDGYWYKNGVKYIDADHPNGIKAEGKDGTGVEIKGSVANYASLPTTGVSIGDCYITEDDRHLWTCTGVNPITWKDLGVFKGDPGANSYMHIAYADSIVLSSGVVQSCSGFTVVKNKDAYDWLGLCTDDNPLDPGASGRDDGSDLANARFYEWNYVKGSNSIRLALDNEHEDFLYNLNGLVAPENGAKSPIHLYDGNNEVTLQTSALSVDSMRTYGVPSSGYYAPSIISENGVNKLYVPKLEGSEAKVTVKTSYLGQYYYAEFTANKTESDKYDIIVKPNAIAFNASETWTTDKTITVVSEGIDNQGNKLSPTISTSSSTSQGNFYIFYGYVKANGRVYNPDSPTTEGTKNLRGTSFTLTQDIANTYYGVYFELRYYTSSDYRLCDYETVEIAKTENPVTYEIVFTEAWARKDNDNYVTGRLKGNAYKIEGATRTALNNATVRYGYTGGIYGDTTTNSNGYFEDQDYFDGNDRWDDTSICNYAKSIYASIRINNVAVCTKYINISFDGSQGPRGATGRMYFMQGKWNANTTYTRTTECIPLVLYSNGNDWNTDLECYGHYYYLNANSATGSDVPGVSSKWVMCDDFAVVISRGIFAEFAKLGSFVISGDWMISQEAVSGSPVSAYTAFNPDYPNSAAPDRNNFIPVYAVDGLTGKVYMNDAHIRGELKAGNIEVTNSQESGYVWSGIAAHSNQSGYDFFTLGIRDYGDGSYMSRLVLNSNGNTGGWFEASVGGEQTSGLLKLGVSKQKTDRVVINSGEVNDPDNSESDQASITVKSSSSGSNTKITPQSVSTENVTASGNINLAGQLLATKIQKTTNSSYNASTSDFIIIFNGGSSQTLYLPTTGLSNGQVIIAIKLYDGDVYIYNGSTYLKKAQKDGGSVAICVCDGTTWY